MKKKLISSLLAISMIITAVQPQITFAEDIEITNEQESESITETEQLNEDVDEGILEDENVEGTEEIIQEIETELETEEILSDEINLVNEEEYTDNNDSKISVQAYNVPVENNLNYNQYYNLSELQSYNATYGTTYRMQINVPKNGKVKLRIVNCLGHAIDTYYGCTANVDGVQQGYRWPWQLINSEEYDSGWFTVNPGKFYFDIMEKDSVNNEMQVIIEYKSIEEYNGEIEKNNSFDTATEMKINTAYEGNASYRNDEKDYYRFHMDQTGSLEIQMTGVCRWDLYEEYTNGNVDCIEQEEYAGKMRVPAGNYFIVVEPWRSNNYDDYNTQSHEYTISAKVTYESPDSYEQEKNNLKMQANSKKANKWYIGNLNNKEDIDWYKIELPISGMVALEFKVPRQIREEQVKISLYDGNMNELDTAANTSNPYIITQNVFRPAGTYYVKVEAGQKYYDFNADYSFNLKYTPCQKVTEIQMPISKKMAVGTTEEISITVLPDNATNKSVSWSSSNTKIATVSNGKVKAKTKGTAIITAMAKDGSGKTASCKVTVGCQITYKLNKGKNNKANPAVYYSGSYILKNPTRKGYVFKGWFADRWFDEQIKKITSKNADGLTLYSKWEKVKVANEKITSVTRKKVDRIVVKYTAVPKAKGYEITYATDKKFKKNCKVVTTKAKSTTLKKLQPKKTYYVKVRAYKLDSAGNKIYGKYSAVKTVKTAKSK